LSLASFLSDQQRQASTSLMRDVSDVLSSLLSHQQQQQQQRSPIPSAAVQKLLEACQGVFGDVAVGGSLSDVLDLYIDGEDV
jgi:hypothetical protein